LGSVVIQHYAGECMLSVDRVWSSSFSAMGVSEGDLLLTSKKYCKLS